MQSNRFQRRRALIQAGGAIAGTAALGVPSLVFAQEKTVKIGFVSPQTGPLAPFGEADAFIIGQMTKLFAGGIDLGGKKVAVKIFQKDSQSNPNRAGEVANDLILKEKVDLMLVSSTPETTNPVSDACELNEIPCISTVAPWQPWFFGRKGDPAKGFDWTYHIFWGLEDVIANFLAGWKSVPTNKKVGGLFPNDGDGNAWGDKERGFPGPLAKEGFTLLDPGRFGRVRRARRQAASSSSWEDSTRIKGPHKRSGRTRPNPPVARITQRAPALEPAVRRGTGSPSVGA